MSSDPVAEAQIPSHARARGAAQAFDTQARPEPLLSLRGVRRAWGRGTRRRMVLDGIDLDLAPGTATGIFGRNGAGKTTLLRIASGILAPDRGSVVLDGRTPDRHWRDFHRRIGFLSAGDRGLYVRLSVRAHLEFWAALAMIPRRERRSAVESALAQFELEELADRRAERLSQGQRQRLRLALTLVHHPDVLLLDEPRNSLDQDGAEMLAGVVRDTLARGGSVIWCAPLGEAQPVQFDHTLVLEAGQLVAP